MQYFKPIEDGFAILYRGGVFRQVNLAERDGFVYAAFGSGFIKIHKGGTTSHKDIKCEEFDIPGGHTTDHHYLKVR